MDLDGTDVGVLGDRRRNGSPAWSPDGSQIAYVVQGETDAGIWVMRADGTGARQLTAGPVAAGPGGQSGADVSPAWSPDGSRIAFARSRSGVLDPRGAGGPDTGIWVVNVDGTGARAADHGPRPGWRTRLVARRRPDRLQQQP